MKRILYIGENEDFATRLSGTAGIKVERTANVVGLHNRLAELPNIDFILSDFSLKGLSGLGIYERFKDEFGNFNIPFGLILSHPEKALRLQLLQSGISEIYSSETGAEVITERIDFLKSMLDARLSHQHIEPSRKYHMPWAKRVFDIVVAGLALVVLSPVIILVCLAIMLESKGPILYVSKRVGTGYKVFDFYKLRSMYVDADKRVADMKHLNQYFNNEDPKVNGKKLNGRLRTSPTLIYKDGRPMSEEEYLELKRKQQAGTFVKFHNDPRITRVGRFIRNTSIDELPQLINVLKGDMSIVGNRPLPLYEAEQLTSDDWGERFLAPAGITGLWQVMKRGKGDMSEEERKALDNQYARKVSLWNDINLIVRTIPALFQKENV